MNFSLSMPLFFYILQDLFILSDLIVFVFVTHNIFLNFLFTIIFCLRTFFSTNQANYSIELLVFLDILLLDILDLKSYIIFF